MSKKKKSIMRFYSVIFVILTAPFSVSFAAEKGLMCIQREFDLAVVQIKTCSIQGNYLFTLLLLF